MGRQAELQDDARVPLQLICFDEHPMRDGLKGLDQVKKGLRMLKPTERGSLSSNQWYRQ